MIRRKLITHSYYIVMIDHPGLGLEAIVQPETTRREVIARIKSHEYQNIAFIHHVDGTMDATDVTSELIDAAETELKEEYVERTSRDMQAAWDHARDLRKHEAV